MRRQEPIEADERKMAYYASLGRFSSGNKEVRSAVGLKNIEAWQQMFPQMWPDMSALPPVSETSAQRLAAVFTCLNIHGETLGSLPFGVKQNTDKGPISAYNNPVHRLIHDRPNPYMTAFDFWSAMKKLMLAWGNAYALIVKNGRFLPSELKLLCPWHVTIQKTLDGEIYYLYKGKQYSSTEILHFKNYTLDGICGISSIRQNALTVGLGLKLNQYNSSVIGDRPPGYITMPNKPKDLEQKQKMRDLWSKRSAAADESEKVKADQVGGIPLLYGGAEFKSFTLPADDVAYIESAKLTTQDIYGIFRVPPTLAQNYEKAPYNSSEQQDIVFVKYSLQSNVGIEQEVTEKMFPESNKVTENNFYAKFNLNAILRGDSAARSTMYSSGINNGYMTPNQVAILEDWPTIEGGDVHMVNSTLIPIKQLEEWIDSKIAKNLSPSPGNSNNDNTNNNQREAIMHEIREILRPRLNGKWSEIEPLLK